MSDRSTKKTAPSRREFVKGSAAIGAGTVAGSNGRCRRVEVTSECHTANECDDREICHEGSCQG